MKNEELEKEGWQKQTTYDEPRLSELVEMYKEMEFDVRVEPFDPSDEPQCSDCMKIFPDVYKTIYIRKKNGGEKI